jgi:hypothetical protein
MHALEAGGPEKTRLGGLEADHDDIRTQDDSE